MAATAAVTRTEQTTFVIPRDIVAREVIDNPTWDELRAMTRSSEWTTQWGNASYLTRVRSRSGAFSKAFIDDAPTAEDLALIEEVRDYVAKQRLIQVDRTLGQGDGRYHCRLLISEHMARVALFWHSALYPAPIDYATHEPDFITLYIEEWPQRRVLIDAENGVTYVLGIDYYGECKKAFLRMGMYHTKVHRGGLGLHAGSKLLTVRNSRGELVERGALFFGLSGTGKTSLTCHPHELEGDERAEILQDDVVYMQPDGSCKGTEEGFYIKTDGLRPEDQPTLFWGIQKPKALLENVWVNPDRTVDFDNLVLSKNGRAIVWRTDIPLCEERIDLDHADLIFFITRNFTIVPPVARLTREQGAAAFMLGESIKTSAADPSADGESVREVGMNPFIVGPRFEEGNRFFEILRKNPGIQCFVLNTGMVGGRDGGNKISLMMSQAIIREIARDTVEWEHDETWGYEVPSSIPGIDVANFDPRRLYSETALVEWVAKLKAARLEWLARFPGLDDRIVRAFPLD